MKISFNWLSEYVDIDSFKSQPEELGKKLTLAGLEIEGTDDQKKTWNHVVVARIIKKKQHPNADRLSLCEVKVGEEVFPIVCGAKNHQEGDWVVAALPGAVLPGDFVIKKSKLRGEPSFGMLCSEKELGLEQSMDGILILSEKNLKEGQAWSEHKQLEDIIFDINITPNRTDCLSHFGVARELSCILDTPLKKTFIPIKEGEFSDFTIQVEEANNKVGYAGCIIKNVKVQQSPLWLKNQLASVGVKSINNIVDITNFIMWELGQPLHVFDLKKVNKGISVREAKAGEKLTTLDNKNIEFKGGELIIANHSDPVALAGIMGGLDSGVSKNTQDIFIESACFNAALVRRTAKSFGIQTDSSDRFSKGTDSEMLLKALNRACELVKDLSGGQLQGEVFYHKPLDLKLEPINIDQSFLESKLGYEVNMKNFDKWLKALGCKIEVLSSVKRKLTPPSFRKDLTQPVDLVEEYARLNGYDKIPEILPNLSTMPSQHNAEYLKIKNLAYLCKGAGLLQAINYNFTNFTFQKEFLGTKVLPKYSTYMGEKGVSVLNPLNSDTNTMRLSLLPGLFQNLIYNYNHNQKTGNLFEIGKVFKKQESSYKEETFLSFMSWGNVEGLWDKSETPLVFQLKGQVESVLKSLKVPFKWKVIKEDSLCPDFLHPKRSMALQVRGKLVGYLGELHPSFAQKHKIKLEVVLAEFNIEFFNQSVITCDSSMLTGKYPSVTRDLSVLCPKGLLSEDVGQLIKKTVGKDLISCKVLGTYSPKDKTVLSITFRLVLQNTDKTYSEEDLQSLQSSIFKNLSEILGVEVPLV